MDTRNRKDGKIFVEFYLEGSKYRGWIKESDITHALHKITNWEYGKGFLVALVDISFGVLGPSPAITLDLDHELSKSHLDKFMRTPPSPLVTFQSLIDWTTKRVESPPKKLPLRKRTLTNRVETFSINNSTKQQAILLHRALDQRDFDQMTREELEEYVHTLHAYGFKSYSNLSQKELIVRFLNRVISSEGPTLQFSNLDELLKILKLK